MSNGIKWRDRIVDTARVRVSTLLDHPLNPKIHNNQQHTDITAALNTLGKIDALRAYRNANGDLVLIDGHLRKSLDPNEEWLILITDLTEDEATLAIGTFDPIGWQAKNDKDLLDALLQETHTTDPDLMALLARTARDAGLYHDKPEDNSRDDGKADSQPGDPKRRWAVKTGDIWSLGKHRLICGDCTDQAVVDRLTQGETARLVVTSPPYTDQRHYQIGEFDWLALANGMFDALPLGNPCDILINLGLSHKDGAVVQYWQPWLDHCERSGHPLFGWYIWDKGSGSPGEWYGRLAPAHEWIFHFKIGKGSANKFVAKNAENIGKRKISSTMRNADGSLSAFTSSDGNNQEYKIADSIIRVTRSSAENTTDHPAVFPVALPAFLIQSWGDPGDVIYEPFAGSGTTIIACEDLGRICLAVEMSPDYCAMILERYLDHTGVEPELLT